MVATTLRTNNWNKVNEKQTNRKWKRKKKTHTHTHRTIYLNELMALNETHKM